MRALFLTLYPESGASSRYRVHQFLPYLREHGVVCEIACPFTEDEFRRYRAEAAAGRARGYHVHEMRTRVAQILAARRYDLVFLQKAITSAYVKGLAGLLRARSRRLVFDVDDAVHLASPNPVPRRWAWAGDARQVERLFARADRVLAGNQWLKECAESAGGRAEYFPTVVDTDRFSPGTPDSQFTVGWIGSPSTSAHLRPVARALSSLRGARLRFVGADRVQASVPKAEYVPWTQESELDELRRFSAGIMPLPKTDWARGKCALKALQYMACGVPCVATPFGAARDIIRDGENGLLADSHEDWVAAIDRLRDPALRARLGEAARATVEHQFSLRAAAPRLRAILDAVAQ